MRIAPLIATAALCLAPLAPSYGGVPGIPCKCPTSPSGPNPALKIVDADLGERLGNTGCALAVKKTTFGWNETVQLRLVVSGGKSLSARDAQIVVRWTDPDGKVTPLPGLCLEPSATYRTCARISAYKPRAWQVTVTDCSGRELLTAPLEFQVTD